MRKIELYGATDGSGDLTVTSIAVHGELFAVEWIDGSLADGVDAVLSFTSSNYNVSRTLLTLTNANDDKIYYPQAPVNDNAGVDVTFDATNEIYTPQVINGEMKLVISAGGDTKSGGCVVHYR